MNSQQSYHINTLKDDQRFKDIKQIFTSLFNSKGYSLSSKIEKDIWFLAKCPKEYNEIYNFTEFIKSNKYNRVIKLINTIHFKSNLSLIEDFNQLSFSYDRIIEIYGDFSIKVEEFINKITILLVTSQIKLDSLGDMTLLDDVKLQRLSEIRKEIEKEIKNETLQSTSNSNYLSVNIKQFQMLPEGEVGFKLIVKEMDSRFNIIKYEKRLGLNKRIKLIRPYEYINLTQMNLSLSDFRFHEVYLEMINTKEFFMYLKSGGIVNIKKFLNKRITDKDLLNIIYNETFGEVDDKENKKESIMKNIDKENDIEKETEYDSSKNVKKSSNRTKNLSLINNLYSIYDKNNSNNYNSNDNSNNNNIKEKYNINSKHASFKRSTSLLKDISFINKSNSILHRLNEKNSLTSVNLPNLNRSSGMNMKRASQFSNDNLHLHQTEMIYVPYEEYDISKYTGLSLYSFGVQVEINGEIFGQSEDFFMDFLIENIENILYINKKDSSADETCPSICNYSVNIKPNEVFLLKNNHYDSNLLGQAKIFLGLNLYLSNELKERIMNFIEKKANDEMEVKRKLERVISEVLSLFEPVRSSIEYRLKIYNDNKTKGRMGCCGCNGSDCKIF